MLAAASPTVDGVLEKLRIFLLLRSENNDYSEVLREHFLRTLSEATRVLEDPTVLNASTPAEVLTLAVQCMKDPEVGRIFQEMDVNVGPSVKEAGAALKSMEESLAFSNKPSHFGEGVFAAF